MPSSYSDRLRLEKQAAGENLNTWGAPRLNTVIDRLEFAIAGLTTIALSGNHTLTTSNTSDDQARAAALKFTGSGSHTVTIPSVSKLYMVWNACSGDLTVTTGAGTTVEVQPTEIALLLCDGAGVAALGFNAKTIKEYVDSVAFEAASGDLPAQAGNAGRFIGTNGSVASWTRIETEDVDGLDQELDKVRGGVETPEGIAILAGVLTVDLGLARSDYKVTLNSNIGSIVYQNAPTTGTLKSWTLRFVGDGVARTVAWPSAVKHNGGTAPTFNTASGKTTTFVQFTDDAGAKIHTFKSGETG